MQIIATLGPACSSVEAASALVTAGATQARLNASHLDRAGLEAMAKLAWKAGFESAVVDLQGGKTRLPTLPAPIELQPGVSVRLEADRPAFLAALHPGDQLRVDDGRFTLHVLEIGEGFVTVSPDGPGQLRSRKGLSLVGREPDLPDQFVQRDVDLLLVALSMGITEVAISYATPGLCSQVRDLAGEDITVAAKIERPSAVASLTALEEECDTLWLCRGDLGAEAGLLALPALQRQALRQATLPLLIAGQVLHHMTRSPRPTRAEVCHASDLLLAGASGFVLSDETAISPHGPVAVQWLEQLQRSTRGAQGA